MKLRLSFSVQPITMEARLRDKGATRMEYEIGDDPQGEADRHEGRRDGGIMEDRIALREQSPVAAVEYSVYGEGDQPTLGTQSTRR